MEVKEKNKRWVLKGRLRRLAGGHYVGDRPSLRTAPNLFPGISSGERRQQQPRGLILWTYLRYLLPHAALSRQSVNR